MNLKIDTYPGGVGESNAPSVEILFDTGEGRPFDGTSASTFAHSLGFGMRISVGNPHQCRELAQQLMGAADRLVDHATASERRAARTLAVGDTVRFENEIERDARDAALAALDKTGVTVPGIALAVGEAAGWKDDPAQGIDLESAQAAQGGAQG